MNAIVFGANGGIGNSLIEALLACNNYDTVFAVSRSGSAPVGSQSFCVDTYDEPALEELASKVSMAGELTLCICAIGILSNDKGLRPERSYRQQTRDAFERIFNINVIIPALIAKHMLPIMPRDARATFAALSARVGSISDNRLGGWHAYRASKAALNMLVKNYAIEQAQRNPNSIVVGLHPGTVDTALSKPFQSNVPSNKLFTPGQAADYLLDVIGSLSPENSGKVFDWAGKEIPA